MVGIVEALMEIMPWVLTACGVLGLVVGAALEVASHIPAGDTEDREED